MAVSVEERGVILLLKEFARQDAVMQQLFGLLNVVFKEGQHAINEMTPAKGCKRHQRSQQAKKIIENQVFGSPTDIGGYG